MFTDEFNADLERGKSAEKIVLDYLAANVDGFTFTDVSNISECRYKGDILAIGENGEEIYIEVKNDSRIADTGNILCEEEVEYKTSGYIGKGNMDCNSDVYAIVSQSERKIYFLNFEKLKKLAKYAPYKEIHHFYQTTYARLVDLYTAKRSGALIGAITY